MKSYWQFLAAASLVLGLSGCGPGTGGTGSAEPDYLAQAGAAAAPVCGEAWSGALKCSTGTDGITVDLGAGTDRVQFAGSGDAAGIVLSLEGDQAVLQVGCPHGEFSGGWGRLPDGATAFFGGWAGGGTSVPQPARLTVQPVGDTAPPTLQIQLRTPDGRLLLGPASLTQVTSGTVAPRDCS